MPICAPYHTENRSELFGFSWIQTRLASVNRASFWIKLFATQRWPEELRLQRRVNEKLRVINNLAFSLPLPGK